MNGAPQWAAGSLALSDILKLEDLTSVPAKGQYTGRRHTRPAGRTPRTFTHSVYVQLAVAGTALH